MLPIGYSEDMASDGMMCSLRLCEEHSVRNVVSLPPRYEAASPSSILSRYSAHLWNSVCKKTRTFHGSSSSKPFVIPSDCPVGTDCVILSTLQWPTMEE